MYLVFGFSMENPTLFREIKPDNQLHTAFATRRATAMAGLAYFGRH